MAGKSLLKIQRRLKMAATFGEEGTPTDGPAAPTECELAWSDRRPRDLLEWMLRILLKVVSVHEKC